MGDDEFRALADGAIRRFSLRPPDPNMLDALLKATRFVAGTFDDEGSEVTVRGQYGPGVIGNEPVSGYLDEPGVPADSRTETFAALRLEVKNWRWAGVPFYLRTGKRLRRRLTEIAIQLRPVPHLAFASAGAVGPA